MHHQFAEDTKVSVEKSRAEIEMIIKRYGGTDFAYMTRADMAIIGFKCNGKFVKFTLPLPAPEEQRFQKCGQYNHLRRSPEAAHKAWDQTCRARWRSLCLCIKAKLEMVNSGITSFEAEFLAHIVSGPGGQTLGDIILPQLDEMQRTGRMPQLLLG